LVTLSRARAMIASRYRVTKSCSIGVRRSSNHSFPEGSRNSNQAQPHISARRAISMQPSRLKVSCMTERCSGRLNSNRAPSGAATRCYAGILPVRFDLSLLQHRVSKEGEYLRSLLPRE
jgi:hypothetical protein